MNHEFIKDIVVGVCELNANFQPSRQVSFRLHYKEARKDRPNAFPKEEPTKEFYEQLGRELYQGIVEAEKTFYEHQEQIEGNTGN